MYRYYVYVLLVIRGFVIVLCESLFVRLFFFGYIVVFNGIVDCVFGIY